MNPTPNLQIVSVTLRPYRNGEHFFPDLEILALAPGQKVADAYSHMVSAGAIWMNGLYFSQSAHLSPETYAAMIDNAKIIELPDYMRYGDNQPATSDADVAQAREYCKRIVAIAHSRMAEAHPSYKPTFTGIEYLAPEEAAKYCHPIRRPRPDEANLTCFEDWMQAVDYRLMNKFGVTSSDLEDYSWESLCADDYTPSEAVLAFCEDNDMCE